MLTFITMRALSASPLMVGGDLPTMDGFSLRLLTDPDMLACNQNGIMGELHAAKAGIEVWRTPHRNDPQQGWVGVFNRSDVAQVFELTRSTLGLAAEGDISVYSVWQGRKTFDFQSDENYPVEIPPDGVIFLRVGS